ncbi:DUF3489 domain-containing protein [Sedimentitalea sp. CAU 1593]|uniref:DUF3489 domain-containing protein n=2 Tax=Sedimentitalea arenosa TaxID=2798803 RepID=A0A8J7JFQ1_9RHOB|nr:DUF3489 domain-containing protein [Arenibacterium arenosum]
MYRAHRPTLRKGLDYRAEPRISVSTPDPFGRSPVPGHGTPSAPEQEDSTMTKTKQTKTARVRAMLRRPKGATIEAICKATGWQPHSARAALSVLRKAGAEIERRPAQTAGAAATYHLAAEPETR